MCMSRLGIELREWSDSSRQTLTLVNVGFMDFIIFCFAEEESDALFYSSATHYTNNLSSELNPKIDSFQPVQKRWRLLVPLDGIAWGIF